MNIDFGNTARDTPQHNYVLEPNIQSLANKGEAMMYRANVSAAIRYQILLKTFETATLLDRSVIVDIYGKKQSS